VTLQELRDAVGIVNRDAAGRPTAIRIYPRGELVTGNVAKREAIATVIAAADRPK